MRIMTFAKRNIKEIIRSPLSLIFCFGFPVFLFLLFQVIISNIPAEQIAYVPQFEINQLTSSIIIFGFTFTTLFGAMLVSKDRDTSFLTRLQSSPMKPYEFILGYLIALFPICLIQIVVTYLMGFCFGLALSLNSLLAILFYIPSAIMFLALGLLFGSIFSERAVGGVCSIVINLAAILGGMFFPLSTMSGAIVIIAKCFPFVHSIEMCTSIFTGSFSGVWLNILVVLAYLIISIVLAIIFFQKKMHSDKK